MKRLSTVGGGSARRVVRVPGLRQRVRGVVRTGAAILAAVLLAPAARGQVSCADPNNLCTGDPCVITGIEVASPCTVDFGSRTLIIDRLILPDSGVVALSAGTIEVKRNIAGRHVRSGGNGANIALIATGDIVVRAPVNTSGNATAGTILMLAGGNVELGAMLRSNPVGSAATATGGVVHVEAGGTLTTTGKGRVEAYSRRTAGGQVILRGHTGVVHDGRTKAYGSSGGSVEISSLVGTVATNREIVATGFSNLGGTILISGSAGATIAETIGAYGAIDGGSIQVTSTAGAVLINGSLYFGGASGAGGTITLTGGASVTVTKSVYAAGRTVGGTIQVSSPTGTVSVNNGLRVHTYSGSGGMITVSAGGPVLTSGSLEASGDLGGGTINVSSTSNGVAIASGQLDASSRDAVGGNVTVTAATAVAVDGGIDVSGETGGLVQVIGASATISDRIEVNGDAGGGSMLVRGLVGDVTISDYLRARGWYGGGGSILVDAANNLKVSRKIDATGGDGGHIQLSAGAALTVEGSSTEVTARGTGNGGNVTIQGATVVIGPGPDLTVAGAVTGGELRCQALSGNLTMDGTFTATGGGGVIEGLAPAGDLTAAGTFTASGGCIGLAASGVLDTSGATFDVPLSASCP